MRKLCTDELLVMLGEEKIGTHMSLFFTAKLSWPQKMIIRRH